MSKLFALVRKHRLSHNYKLHFCSQRYKQPICGARLAAVVLGDKRHTRWMDVSELPSVLWSDHICRSCAKNALFVAAQEYHMESSRRAAQMLSRFGFTAEALDWKSVRVANEDVLALCARIR